VDSETRSHAAWGLSAEQFEKRASDDWLDTRSDLIVILLLSLGLWAVIWGAVGSLLGATL
jgi:hypothetical protein